VVRNEALKEVGGLAAGGGIFSNGTLTLRESEVFANVAIAHGGDENIAAGAGIESEGNLFVERSTISANLAEALAQGGKKSEAVGAGLALVSGTVTIEESTISDNSAFAAEGTEYDVARGGGIWAAGAGPTIEGSTITGNGAQIDGAGAVIRFVGGDNLAAGGLIRNSIVSDPHGESESCDNSPVSGGFNLDEDGSCGFGKSSDLVGVAAGLDPVLRDNGGPTPTHALLPGSIAIDRGNSFGATVDQRGLRRPSDFPAIGNKEGGDGSDIGAFELQVPPPSAEPARVTEVPADRTPPNTRIVRGPARLGFKRLAKFRFASTEPQSTFQCKLDGKKWKACANPFKRSVKPGRHRFKVRAIDRFGNVDPSPARFGWRVKPLS
jgi:large repetitive protein